MTIPASIIRSVMSAPLPRPLPFLAARARWKALKHIRFIFPRKGCRIWRLYSHFGFKTYRVMCECGEEFK